MISFEDALTSIRLMVAPLTRVERIDLEMALSRTLASAIISSRPNPSFDNSAVDGYLLGSSSGNNGQKLKVVGEIRAGSLSPFEVPEIGQAVRIFTGAPVPKGSFCIVMQEDVARSGDSIMLNEDVGEHQSIRWAGADFQAGTELVAPGTRMTAAEIALARWNGTQSIEVFFEPRVSVLVTGDEIVQPGVETQEGQIYDSNGPMLEALVRSEVQSRTIRGQLSDDFEKTQRKLTSLAKENELILISGGASVGDHDHIPNAVESLGEIFFHKVSIKPGKPVLFGKIETAYVFGLPGNPASAYVCFQIFVREALRRLAGETKWEQQWLPGRYGGSHDAANRDEFIRVTLETRNGEIWAEPAFEQGSFGLRSLSAGRALARLQANRSYNPGDPVSLMILPK